MTQSRQGKSIKFTNGGSAVVKGAVVVIGNCLAIAAMNVAAGAEGIAHLEGVFTAPKVSGAVIAQGEKLVYDVSASAFDDSSATPASGDVTGGAVAMAAGVDGDTTISVMLTPGNTAVA